MESAVFYIFAFLTLACGLLVIANPFTRNPVTSAMFLVLTIVSMAGLFIQLHAFFLAAVQILVYAGAVMVLFVFVIMLLDLKQEERRKIKGVMATLAVIAVGMIAFAMVKTIKQSSREVGFNLNPPTLEGSTVLIGQRIFSQYALPFEILSLLLLAAMIGAILLSKKDLK
jgi:NADH-quinone oxidoreductase subunit J